MRILLANENRGWGGAEEHTLRLARALLDKGHGVSLAAQPGSKLSCAGKAEGVPVHYIRMRNELDVAAVASIAFLLKQHKVEVLHVAATRDHILAAAAARLLGIPVAKVEHTFLGPDVSPLCFFAYRRWTDRVVCVSRALMHDLTLRGIPEEKIVVIPNGIDTVHFRRQDRGGALRRSWAMPEAAPVVAVVASFIPEKGHDTMLKALPRLRGTFPDLRVLLAGTGPLETCLRGEASRLEVADLLLWLGHLEDVRPVMEAADVVVLPSRKETMGYVLMEAMALECPVVGTKVGGIPELVEDGKTGRLAEPGRPEDLARCITQVLTDPQARRAMGIAARSRIEEKFSLSRMVSAYEDLYLTLAGASGNPLKRLPARTKI